MNSAEWYGAGLGLFFAVWIIYRITSRLLRLLLAGVSFFLLKHLFYPRGIGRGAWWGDISRFQMLAVVSYILANAICMAWGFKSLAQFSSRVAFLSTINLVPLFAGSQLSLAADTLGVSLRTQIRMHTWMGLMSSVQAVLHSVLSVTHRSFDGWDEFTISGITAAGSMTLICLMSLVFFQAHLYEVFLRFHLVLALTVMVSLWRHLHVRQKAARLYLAIGFGLWGSLSIILFLTNLVRNIRVRGPWLAQTTITERDGLYRLEVTMPRAWNVRAGHFVYLRIPRVSFWAFLQSHPFAICWSEPLPGGGMRLFMLMEPRRGFTRRLASHSGYSLMTWVDGPYGRSHHDFGEYGTVVMIATGVGIAAQLPHLRELSRGQKNLEVRTRRILVLWMFEKEAHLKAVKEWMDELLTTDTPERTLDCKRFLMESTSDKKRTNFVDRNGVHDKVETYYNPADITSVLRDELTTRRGKLVIVVSAYQDMRKEIRDIVRERLHEDMRLVELEFQPEDRHHSSAFRLGSSDVA